MKKASLAVILVIACAASAAIAGCGGGPSDNLKSFLGTLQGAGRTRAAAYCYDRYSYQEITDSLAEDARAEASSVGGAEEKGAQRVRKRSFEIKPVASVEALMQGPRQDLDNRYKPLMDSANAELTNAQLELKTAQEQLKYSAETYGKNMPQYYAEQKRIWQIQPRVNRAQSKVDTLKAQYQAELASITAAAEAEHKKEKSEMEKLLAKNSVRLPACEVDVAFGKGGSSDRRTFTLVKYIKEWRVYSVAEPVPAAGKTPGAKTTTPSTTPSTAPGSAPGSSPEK